LIIIILISIPLAKNLTKKRSVNLEIKELEEEINRLESSSENLKGLIDYLESDQFVEEQARLKLGLKKPGEEAVVIKELPKDSSVNLNGNKNNELNINNSNYYKWFKYFFVK
jgi:cell division protein FtsB